MLLKDIYAPTHPAGRVAKVIDDIVDTVYSAGKGDLDDKSRIGSVYWNLGVLAGVFHRSIKNCSRKIWT